MFEVNEALLKAIREGCEEAEQTRQMSPQVVEAIKEAQLASMAVAPAYGGTGATLTEMAQVLEAIAYEDAAASWVVWNATLVGFYARFMPPSLREILFSSGSALFCQSTIPAGEIEIGPDQATVTGRWPLMSGSPSADWAIFTCRVRAHDEAVVTDEGQPVTRLAALHRNEFEILDTWHTNGLRGTGSHDVVVTSAAIPHQRLFDIQTEPNRQTPSDYLPIFASISALFSAQLLGLGRAVYDASIDRAKRSQPIGHMPALKEREDFQIAAARHGASLEASANSLQKAIRKIDTDATGQVECETIDVANLYASSIFVMDMIKRSTEQWAKLAGTSALYTDSPLEKRVRDLSAMERHIVAQSGFQADAGRLSLGLDPSWPLYLV